MSTDELNNLQIVGEDTEEQILEKFQKEFPIETFLGKTETAQFIFELAELFKLYSEKDYKIILPKIASCIDIDIKNGSLNKKTIEKVKLCLKK